MWRMMLALLRLLLLLLLRRLLLNVQNMAHASPHPQARSDSSLRLPRSTLPTIESYNTTPRPPADHPKYNTRGKLLPAAPHKSVSKFPKARFTTLTSKARILGSR